MGNSKPENKKEARKQAIAIAYSMKKNEDLKNFPTNVIMNDMLENIKNCILNLTNCEQYSDILSKFGKDTPHFMMDRIKSRLEGRGYEVEYTDEGDNFNVKVLRNGKLIKELELDKLKIADDEIRDRDII